jgi:hypothetical protein
MKWTGTKNVRMLLLAIWLIATGVLAFVHISFDLYWPRSPSLPVCCFCWVATLG